MNKQFFYGAYRRIGSFFEGSELASSALPTGLELEILEAVRGQVPAEVFTTEYKNPVNGNPEAVRNNLREATRLLREAGYEIRNQKLVNAKTGEPMTVEFKNPVGAAPTQAPIGHRQPTIRDLPPDVARAQEQPADVPHGEQQPESVPSRAQSRARAGGPPTLEVGPNARRLGAGP